MQPFTWDFLTQPSPLLIMSKNRSAQKIMVCTSTSLLEWVASQLTLSSADTNFTIFVPFFERGWLCSALQVIPLTRDDDDDVQGGGALSQNFVRFEDLTAPRPGCQCMGPKPST